MNILCFSHLSVCLSLGICEDMHENKYFYWGANVSVYLQKSVIQLYICQSTCHIYNCITTYIYIKWFTNVSYLLGCLCVEICICLFISVKIIFCIVFSNHVWWKEVYFAKHLSSLDKVKKVERKKEIGKPKFSDLYSKHKKWAFSYYLWKNTSTKFCVHVCDWFFFI